MNPELVTLAVHPDGTTDVVVEPAHPCARCGVPTVLGAVRLVGDRNRFQCWGCDAKERYRLEGIAPEPPDAPRPTTRRPGA